MKTLWGKLRFILYTFLLIITVASAANAASWTVTSTASLGSSSQGREAVASTAITLQNTDANTSITGITSSFTSTLPGFLSSDFNVTLTGVPTSIAANASSIVTVSGYVPIDFDSGNRKIGNLLLSATSGNSTLTKTVEVYMNAESKLEISRVEIEVDGNSERVSDGETIDAKRNDPVTLTVTVENKFSSSSNIIIDDVDVTVESNNLDIDEQETIGDIRENDDDSVDISFDILDDADDGKETVTIIATGIDENGAEHTYEFEFEFDITVERYELSINDITIFPSSVCQGSDIRIDVDVENTGLRDLDEGMVYIQSDDLDVTRKITNLEIDEGDDDTVTTSITIPKDMDMGTYYLDVIAYYDAGSSSESDADIGIFSVKDCTVAKPTNTTGSTGTGSGIEVIDTTKPTTGQVIGVPVTKSKAGLFDSNGYIVLLVLTNILLIVLIVVLMMPRMKKN